MKLCDLTQFYSPVSGGVKRYLHEKVQYLNDRREDEHVLIVPGDRDAMTQTGRAKTYSLKSPLISKTSRYRALLRLEAVEEILMREKPDLIESSDPYQVAWKAIASGQGLGIPVVGFYHSHFPEAYLRSVTKFFGKTASAFVMDLAERYVKTLYNRFEKTLVPSPALGRVLGSWGVENVENIDLGVNTEIFKPREGRETRQELGVTDGKILLLYVGRLAAEKNTRTLFEAFQWLHGRAPGKFHLLAVGDGTQRERLKELETKTGATTWIPYCTDSMRLAELYSAADLFVHPGVQETFGLVTLESQACGTPVVGIRGSYMDRIICTDQTHWAADNTAAALGEAILEAAGQDLKAVGALASERVRRQYSWERVFSHLFAIYGMVIQTYKERRQ